MHAITGDTLEGVVAGRFRIRLSMGVRGYNGITMSVRNLG
jgi:hypothetical protein